MIPRMLATSDLIERIRSFGVVAGGSFPDEAKADLYVSRAVVGKEKRVVVTACEMSGKPFPSGGERVEASLSLLGSKYPPVLAKTVDNTDGTYTTSFIPQRIGEHEVSITIEGKHIKGSPFSVYVRQDRNYRSLSNVQRRFTVSAGPYGVAVDDSETYIAVYGNNSIEVLNQNGQCVRTIGNTRKLPGMLYAGVPMTSVHSTVQISSPSAIAIQGGVLYVVESGSSRVQKLTTSGTFISSFGTPGTGNGQLKNPRGICFDSSGCVFISDSGNNRVSVFNADGTFLHHIIGNIADGSNLNAPWGLAFDHRENLHVADTNTRMIKVFSLQGQFVTQYDSGVSQPAGIVIDDEGRIFIADYGSNNSASRKGRAYQNRVHMSQVPRSNQVCILDSNYNIIHSFGAMNQNNAYTGITVDKEGYVYVCNMNYHQVYKF